MDIATANRLKKSGWNPEEVDKYLNLKSKKTGKYKIIITGDKIMTIFLS